MNYRIAFLIVSLLACLSPSLGLAGENIGGTVKDASTGAPIAQVRVSVRSAQAEDRTRADGSFSLPDVPSEAFVLVVTCPGYEPELVRVRPSREKPLEIALRPIKERGDEIVVTASRYGADVPLSRSNVSHQELQERDADQDIPMILEDLPGVYASTDAGNGAGYTYLSVRGFDARRVGVMVDGIPLNDPEDHQVYWVDLPDFASSIEDIQVQRGVVNGIGGVSAIGGTVNLQTQVLGVEPAGRMAFSVGSYNTRVESLSYQTGLLAGRFASGMRFSHLQSDGYRDRSGTDQWGLFWSGRLIGARSSTQLNIYTGHERSQQAWDGIDEATWALDRTANPETYWNAIDDFRQPHFDLHHEWRPGERLRVQNSLYYVHGRGFYENLKEGEEAGDYGLDTLLPGTSAEAVVDLVRQKWVTKDHIGWVPSCSIDHARGRLLVGGDAYLFWSRHEGEILSLPGLLPQGLLAEGMPYYRYRGEKRAFSLYLDEKVETLRRLTLLANLQVQHRTYDFMQDEVGGFVGELRNAYSVTYNFLNPRGGLSYRIPEKTLGAEGTAYAWVGLSHREPADAELYDTWSGPDDLGVEPLFQKSERVTGGDGSVDYVKWSDPLVEPERVLDYELGTTWRNDSFDLALTGYWMDFQNEIIPYGALDDDGYGIRGNAGHTLHRGVEAMLRLQPVETQRISLAGSKSFDTFQEFTFYDWDGSTQDYAGNPIASFPQWMANARWTADWKVLETMLRARGIGRIYLDNTGDDERSLEPWFVLDAGVGFKPARWGIRGLKGLDLNLTCRNLLNEKYATSGYYDGWGAGNYVIPAAGRNWLAGGTWEF